MKKSQLRNKILKTRKLKRNTNLKINPKKVLNIIKKNKFKSNIIGGYYPFNNEIDCLEILKILKKKNYLISLPKISKKNKMNFFTWSYQEPLKINIFGIPEPQSSKVVIPDIFLVPLVAFDRHLNRLGYGGGYYDRYLKKVLKKKKIILIGFGYSFQEVYELPINNYDIKLNYIITEKKIIS